MKKAREGKVGLFVYLDIIWLLNFCFDLLLILLTALMLKRRLKWLNIILAAIIGSSMVVLLFTPLSTIASHPLTKFFVSCLIALCAFGFGRFRFFIQNVLAFYFVSFVIGGTLLGTYYFFEFSFVFQDTLMMTNSNGFGDPISWAFVLVGFPIAWYYARHQFDQVEMTKIQYDQIVHVTITVAEKKVAMNGLIDSGNHLCDPITKVPVMIAETDHILHLIPEEIHPLLTCENPLDKMHETEHSFMNRLRVIPYRGVGQDHQFLFAFRPDKVSIEKEEGTLVIRKVLIGLNNRMLSSDGHYECILHPKMIQIGKMEHVS